VSFIATIYGHLSTWPDKPYLSEVFGDRVEPTTGRRMTSLIARFRGGLRSRGVAPGDRVVLLAPNSARWVAADLAMLGEGAIVVPLYARQDPGELVAMTRDCGAKLVVVADATLGRAVAARGADAPVVTFEELGKAEPIEAPPHERAPDEPVTIIYTSGSTGEPKGVVTTLGNVDYMLPQTATALGRMMALGGPVAGDEVVFHYLPFCFAGSRIVLWTSLYRNNGLHVSTDLDRLADEIATVKPHYFLNVPVLLERIKNKVEDGLAKKPAPIRAIARRGFEAHARRAAGAATFVDRAAYRLADALVFRAIRAKVGPRLRCLICGSAPLGEDTQRWFQALGIPVYQVYGLTETTAIVTMDTPAGRVVPGRVGPALPGVEVRTAEGDELQVRGPNVFPRYWNNATATAAAFTDDGWFRTADRAEVDEQGNWKIIGRLKNLLVPTSGHNVAPEPIEQLLTERIPGVDVAVLVGHARPFLTAILSGPTDRDAVQRALDAINADLPHYKRVRGFHLADEPFTPENGLLTANQKVKRDAVEAQFAAAIAGLYP
jgi:long-chain acyl-CoA synthetase